MAVMYTSESGERAALRMTADEYKDSIVAHMIEQDQRTRPDPQMIDMQPELNWRLWPFIVDFVVQLHSKLRLEPQTLFMAINTLNRYCSKRIVFRRHLQLVGMSALWLAAKYEDKKGRVPSLATLNRLCRNAYDEQMFVQMEAHILMTLEWKLTHATTDAFLGLLISQPSVSSPLLKSLAAYISEITLYHREFIGSDPLNVARAIQDICLRILNVQLPGLAESEETDIHSLIYEIIETPPATLVRKFSTPENMQVTQLIDQFVLRRRRLRLNDDVWEYQQALAGASTSSLIPSDGIIGGGFPSPLTPPPSVPRSVVSSSGSSDFTSPMGSVVSTDVTMDTPVSSSSVPAWSGIAPIGSAGTTRSPPLTPLVPPPKRANTGRPN